MLAPILADFPGSLFFNALRQGEPIAFVILAFLIGVIFVVTLMKHTKSKTANSA
jgi:hypothetical protein